MCCSLRFRRDGVGLCAVDATCRGEGARFCDGSVFYVGISVSRFRSSSRCQCGPRVETQASVLRYAIDFEREAKNKDATQNKWARRKLAS